MRVLASVALCAVAVTCHAADLVMVRGGSAYDGITANLLDSAGLEYDSIAEDAAVEGALADYRMAIFPFNPKYRGEGLDRVVEFVEGGGKLMWMSGIPSTLQEMLGIGEWESRGKSYPGEFGVMVFAEDRPPEFPATVHQTSPNSRIVHEVLDHARVLAVWHDTEGKDLGFPAVIATDDTLWTAHVFWHGANADEQRHLLMATVAYLLPDTLPGMVEGVMAEALELGGYDDLDSLVAAAEAHPGALPIARRARDNVAQVRELLASETPGAALSVADTVRGDIQTAAAAVFPSRPYELRGAWMHPDDAFDYEAAMQELADANFNAVFPIVCGPNYAKYPSDYAPQYTERDHVRECLEAAHRHGIEVHLWKANWQTSPSRNPEVVEQFIADGRMVTSIDQARGGEEKGRYPWSKLWLDPSEERNRQLEFDMMMELVEKYHPDGIHYDFMRYPSGSYCYCDRCRAKFQQWAQVTVENWPDDCHGAGKLADRYRDWRRHLQTSLVEKIAQAARALDPDVKISLAARASMTGSFDGDAQDWVTWAHEHYLDLLCPMDYTSSVGVLRRKLEPQVEAIDGAIPVYAGIGVSPTRSATPVNLSQQITLARELGADGFLMFSLSPFSRAMLPALALGATSTPVDIMPHHAQSATAAFTYPEGVAEAPKRTYAPGTRLDVRVSLAATGQGIEQLTVQALVMPAAGGEAATLTDYLSSKQAARDLTVQLQPEPGICQVILRGEVVFKDGREEPFYLRSQPLTILTQEQLDDLLARVQPPSFETDKVHVGVIMGGYGSEGLLAALRGSDEVEARPVGRLEPEFMTPCQVLIFPQPRENPRSVTAEVVESLREFVQSGGGLMALRDVLGAWIYPVLFVEVAKGAGLPVKRTQVVVTADHPLTAGMKVGDTFRHAYSDHVPLAVGEAGTVVIKDAGDNPVVACAEVGKGRYVACGMAIGRDAASGDVVPVGGELTLLTNAVAWLGK